MPSGSATVPSRPSYTAGCPPTNWFSDDVMCRDLDKFGYQHFISRSYVHHAGSQSIGRDSQKLMDAPREWIKENRPEYYKEWYGS